MLREADLHPLDDLTASASGLPHPGGGDVNINLDITFDTTSIAFFVNEKMFIPPPVPVLLQILSGAKSVQELLPQGLIYTLPRNKVVEISMPGGALFGPVSDKTYQYRGNY